jgi:SAM-dependent methyltransferase
MISSARLRSWKAKYRYGISNLGYRLAPTLDGYPLPPARLVELVIGTRELAWYQLGGLFMQQAFGTLLRRHGVPFEVHGTILDFGCGCGRILRWLGALKGHCRIWGTDCNPRLVDWCRRHLSDLAEVGVNQSDPPLRYEDGQFSLVYSYSVLTHLSRERQEPWLRELARVTRTGGYLMLTVHGRRTALRMTLSADVLAQIEREGVVVFSEDHSGETACCAFHSEGFMRSLDRFGLDLVEFISGGAVDASEQDLYLFRRRG